MLPIRAGQSRLVWWSVALVAALVLQAAPAGYAAAQWPAIMAQVPVGASPAGVAVNPATNKIYVGGNGVVSVINGTTNAVTSIGVATSALVGVNPVTNRIYASSAAASLVTVIDGSTDTVITTVSMPSPTSLAVNPVTNKIYAVCMSDGSVMVIDGVTNAVTRVAIGQLPETLAVNVVTNKIYVGKNSSTSISVIDGATNQVTTVKAGGNPIFVAVNAVTNRIYASNASDGTISVIDGSNNSVVATLSAGDALAAFAINPVTNLVYVSRYFANSLAIINGATNQVVATLPIPTAKDVAVNTQTNLVFIVSENGVVYVIDGANNTILNTLTTSIKGSAAISINPVTNLVYVTDQYDNRVTVIDGSLNSVASIPAPAELYASAVNPATNRIYVAGETNSRLLEIDGESDTVIGNYDVGTYPEAVAVNPVTNRVYVANAGDGTVSVVDLSSHSTTTLGVDLDPISVAVNSATNKIYVLNREGTDPNSQSPGTVTVIDGTTGSTSRVIVGRDPYKVAVNPVTNKIYVDSESANIVTVIDGYTQHTTTVATGANPYDLAVNSVTNKIYTPNYDGNTVTVINGADNTTTTVPVGINPRCVDLNAVTNKIYVGTDGGINVIDGKTNDTNRVELGFDVYKIVVNPTTNKIYATYDGDEDNLAVIDGVSNTAVVMHVPQSSRQTGTMVANPFTGKIYATTTLGWVMVLTPNSRQTIPLDTTGKGVKDGLTDTKAKIFATRSRNVGFTGVVKSNYVPKAPAPTTLYYQVDSTLGNWLQAKATTNPGANPAGFQFAASALTPGVHTVYLYSAYGEEGTTEGTSNGISAQLSNLVGYPFAVLGNPRVSVSLSGTGTGVVFSSDHRLNCGQVCSADYNVNSYAWLEAVPTGSSRFAGWTGCDKLYGTSCMVYMNDSRQVTASFKKPTQHYQVKQQGVAAGRGRSLEQ